MDSTRSASSIGTDIALSENPYRPPRAGASAAIQPGARTVALAQRRTRLVAVLIDYLCLLVPTTSALAAFLYLDATSTEGYDHLVLAAFLLGLVLIGGAQTVLLVRSGQTFGKKWMRIRIVRHEDGAALHWMRLLLLRYGVSLILRQVPFYFLVDALFVLRDERRCLHDLIAGTKVIEADP